MGRRSNTDQRRAQIRAAFLAELAAVGYQRITIKSVARRAGLAAGLVHYHFADKQEILLTALDSLIEQANARLAGLRAMATSPIERLRAHVDARVAFGGALEAGQVGAWTNVLHEAAGQPELRTRVRRWLRSGHRALADDFAAAGSAAPGEHAALLSAMILGVFSQHVLAVPGVPVGYAQRRIREWLDWTVAGSSPAGAPVMRAPPSAVQRARARR